MKRLDLQVVRSITVPGYASLRSLEGVDGPSVQRLLSEHGFVAGERVTVLLTTDAERALAAAEPSTTSGLQV